MVRTGKSEHPIFWTTYYNYPVTAALRLRVNEYAAYSRRQLFANAAIADSRVAA
jgi:hypothetical protein